MYDEYGAKVVKGKTLYEFQLSLDQFKSVNQRSSTQVYDYLGDVGGFQAAFTSVFATVGAFFSTRFYASSIANNLYKKKKSK